MSEWKGPWKCEKCGRVFRHTEDRRDAKRAGGHVGLPSGQFCKGILKPYDRRAPDPLLDLVREARDALAALLMMMDRGSKPRKLDEAITWKENDEKARAMGRAAFSRLDVALVEAPKAEEGSRE